MIYSNPLTDDERTQLQAIAFVFDRLSDAHPDKAPYLSVLISVCEFLGGFLRDLGDLPTSGSGPKPVRDFNDLDKYIAYLRSHPSSALEKVAIDLEQHLGGRLYLSHILILFENYSQRWKIENPEVPDRRAIDSSSRAAIDAAVDVVGPHSSVELSGLVEFPEPPYTDEVNFVPRDIESDALAATALSPIEQLIENPRGVFEPRTGFGPFPPEPRSVVFEDVRYGRKGTRLTVDEYLADDEFGWHAYTSRKLMTVTWLDELDRTLSAALRYQAKSDLTARGIVPRTPEWFTAQDDYYFERGIFTPGYLDTSHPPSGYEWNSDFLTFMLKLQTPLHKGSRPTFERET